MTTSLRKALHGAVVIVSAVALTMPFLVWGLVPGHDRRLHIEYQHFFNQQLEAGERYPRWIPGLNLGRGSPIFFAQYPLPYYVAWGLGHLIPNHWGIYTESHSLGMGVVLATILGTLFTYAWCAAFTDSLSAVLASIVFLTLPYFFSIDVYTRAAVGEIWALAFIPLALYFMERRDVQPRRSLAGVAAAFGLVLLSHLFTAVMLWPVLLAYALWHSEPAQRFSAFLQTVVALALGTGLAGIYILPLYAQRHFLHPENLIAFYGANYSPLSQMFPYDRAMFPRDTAQWFYLGWAARCLAGGAFCLLAYAWYCWKREGLFRLRTFLSAVSILLLGLTLLAGNLPGVGAIPGGLPVTHPVVVNFRAHIFLASFLTLLGALLCYSFLQAKEEVAWKANDPAKTNEAEKTDRPQKRAEASRTRAGLADFLMAVALLSFLMMTRWSLPVWNAIHALWSIQFPWRFNVLLAVAAAGLAALAISNLAQLTSRERVLAGVAGVFLWGLAAVGTAWAANVEGAYWGTRPEENKPSRDLALPVYAQVKSLEETADILTSPQDTVSVTVTSGKGHAEVKMPGPRRMELYAACESECTLRISQFYYPAWRARLAQSNSSGAIALPAGKDNAAISPPSSALDRREITLCAASPGGMMELSLPSGTHDVVLDLPRGWPERCGPWLSLLSFVLLVLFALADKPEGKESAGTQKPQRSLQNRPTGVA